jgi:hypothetical protein
MACRGCIPEHRHLAAVRLGQAKDHVDGRRLAGAVRPEERDNVARGDAEVDAFDRVNGSEGFVHAHEVDRERLAAVQP